VGLKSIKKHINTLCGQNVYFLCAFAKSRKATIGVRHVPLSVRPSVRMERLDCQLKDFHEKLYSKVFENLS